MSTTTTTYWCYRCSHFVRVVVNPTTHTDSLSCPDCTSGFIEHLSLSGRRRFPMYNPHSSFIPSSSPRLRRSRRGAGDRSPFNPVIVLRNSSPPNSRAFELYYDDGSGSGLRPLPSSMSEFLLGSGFDRLLDQLTLIESAHGLSLDNNLNTNNNNHLTAAAASKAAIDSLPHVEIVGVHLDVESHCAVCKEAFELGSEAREMPCKHLYHEECILPWLVLRNSCPVCRHELPSDNDQIGGGEDETVGLTIWRLPGGGFAVGRFAGGRRGSGERELPVVYTEMDGGFGNGGNGVGRRVAWGSRGNVERERGGGGGFRRVISSLFACFGGRGGGGGSSRGSSLDSRMSRRSGGGSLSMSSVFSSSSRRRQRGWGLEINDGSDRRW